MKTRLAEPFSEKKKKRESSHSSPRADTNGANEKTLIALHESELKFRRLFETAQDGILILNAETGEITDVNPFLIKMLGYTEQEFQKKKLWEIGPISNVFPSKKSFEKLQKKKYIRYENLPLETWDGKRINVEFVSNVYSVGNKNVIQCNIRDITERWQVEQKIKFLSTHDVLTQLYNRTFFEEEMHRLEHSRQYPISIIMADVDGMKHINDTYGHAVGDEVLQRSAKVLLLSFREEDIVARIGGDEFVILLPNTNAPVAKKGKERVKSILFQENQKSTGQPIGISLGAATANKPCGLSEVLKQADKCMYKMKNARSGGMK